jgi:drug/metabolite transporter (DMT)-like permease
MNTSLYRQYRGELLILAAAVIWGFAFYFQKTAMLSIGPLLFVSLRVAIAAIALAPLALKEQRHRNTSTGDVVPIACLGGFVIFCAAALQQIGLVTTTVINTGFLSALYVVATPLLYWAIERKRPANQIWLAVGVATVGVGLLNGLPLASLSRGDLLVTSSSVFWALNFIVVARAGVHEAPLTYTCISFATAALISLVMATAFETISLSIIYAARFELLFVGLFSSALTFAMMAIALRTVSAPRAAILLTTELIFASIAGLWLLGEGLSVLGIVGAGLILMAVLIAQRPINKTAA